MIDFNIKFALRNLRKKNVSIIDNMKCNKSLDKIISQLGAIDDQSMQLMNLTAIVASKSLPEIENHINSILKMGVEPSRVYHAIIGVSKTVGLTRAINSLKIAERIVNHSF